MADDSGGPPRSGTPKRRKASSVASREGDTARLNTLADSRAQERAPSSGPKAAGPKKKSDGAARRPSAAGAVDQEGPSRAVPDEIRERFIGIGTKYYFPDGVAAFADHGSKLTTRSENTEVIRSLVAIAQAREWGDIKVTGTERFRKEAWFAARLVGIEVKGYKPTAFEEERMVRAVARRDAGAVGRDPNGATSTQDRSPTNEERKTRSTEDAGPIAGRLVDHGRANYRHNPKEPMSYYVRVETERGDREIWGVDLERAFRDSLSRPTLGDPVTVRPQGRDPVSVSALERDDEGRIVGKQEKETHRNRWSVERTDFLAERAAAAQVFRDARVTAAEAIKAHPELQGSYLVLQAAKLGAERDIPNPEDRTRFVERARLSIAEAIERGEPLEAVRLRERSQERAEADKARERDQTRTR
jgi:Large polyvalent protein-associated domain 7